MTQALIEATYLTGVRTAAASAVAARILATYPSTVNWVHDSKQINISIIGAGVQAEHHIHALLSPKSLRGVVKQPTSTSSYIFHFYIFNRTVSRAEALVSKLAFQYPFASFAAYPLPGKGDTTEIELLRSSQVICLTTGSDIPVLYGDWLSKTEPVLIIAVGSYTPLAREMDDEVIRRLSCVAVDSEEAFEAGDIAIPLKNGSLSQDTIRFGSLGELITKFKNQTTQNGHGFEECGKNVTLFKSVGTAVLDIATAALVRRKWKANVKANVSHEEAEHFL